MTDLKSVFAQTDYSEAALENAFKAYLADKGYGFGQVGPVLRLAMAGTTQGPSIFTVMQLIGQEASERRIDQALVRFREDVFATHRPRSPARVCLPRLHGRRGYHWL